MYKYLQIQHELDTKNNTQLAVIIFKLRRISQRPVLSDASDSSQNQREQLSGSLRMLLFTFMVQKPRETQQGDGRP